MNPQKIDEQRRQSAQAYQRLVDDGYTLLEANMLTLAEHGNEREKTASRAWLLENSPAPRSA